ncbi:unnamed protein product [Nippostrongylus brasiliensis]|uniref:NADPH--cytochrome P450 reductase (inferred by orthology to a C. elegans protein) n=1 Tax=Nippostrongylus brasiliensis TaxID=27835 RepID=A0A0N4XQ79_NIPBR|nr:unnamed protein product [Nippostrongylus brasiliensis]
MARLAEIQDCLVVFCMATYGEGDPTDNAQQLYEYINTTDTDFKGVSYAVSGIQFFSIFFSFFQIVHF